MWMLQVEKNGERYREQVLRELRQVGKLSQLPDFLFVILCKNISTDFSVEIKLLLDRIEI